MGDTCSTLIGTSIFIYWLEKCLKKSIGDGRPLQDSKENTNPEKTRTTCQTFPTTPTPHLVPKPPEGENGQVSSLVDICIRRLCQHPEAWGEIPEGGLPASQQSSIFSTLAPELISKVFVQLASYRLINENTLKHFEHLPISKVTCQAYYGLNDSCFASIATFQEVTVVDFSGLVLLSDIQLQKLSAPNFTRGLRTVKLDMCYKLTDDSVAPLVRSSSSSLTTLSLVGCTGLAGSTMSAMQHCSRLRHLGIGRCDQFDPAALSRLIAKIHSSLEYLDISLLGSRASGILDAAFETNSKGETYTLPVKVLLAGWCKLSPTSLASIGSRCSFLEVIDFSKCDCSDKELIKIARGCPSVRQLELSGCRELGTNLGYLNAFSNLRHLILNRVKVTKLPDELTRLRSLSLAHSDIADGVLRTIGTTMQRLEVLNLDACEIDSNHFEFLRNLENVREINLCDTEVDDQALRGLGSRFLRGVLKIDLAGSHLALPGLVSLGLHLSSVEELSLGSPNLNDQALQFMLEPHRIQARKLDLFSAPISALGCESLSRYLSNSLVELDLCGGLVSDIGVESLCKLTLLEHLNISSNYKISDPSMQRIAVKLCKLRVLNISHTGVTTVGIELLKQSKLLEQLIAGGCSGITAEWVQEFQLRVPNLWFTVYEELL